MNSTDSKIRYMQAQLRSFGKQEGLVKEYQKKDITELEEMRIKGNKWIAAALEKLLSTQSKDLQDKFDEMVGKLEAIEIAIDSKLKVLEKNNTVDKLSDDEIEMLLL